MRRGKVLLRRQAGPGFGPAWPSAVEVAHLLIHGILHLLGYDHGGPEEERRMLAKEEALLHFLAEWSSASGGVVLEGSYSSMMMVPTMPASTWPGTEQ